MASRRVPDDGRITEPGEYVLTGDRGIRGASPPSDAMIRIVSDGVTLDGRGHAVVGNGISDTTAIAADGESVLSDVVVENVAVEAWEVGLSLQSVDRATIRGVEATGNSYGLLLEGVAAPRLTNCAIRENLVGVSVDAASPPASAFDPRRDNDVSNNRLADVHREDDC
ncbi:periplasmic copper-binding protein [Halogeometricum pallidum JCM 14848]|uniref:Periplasmic copper-binding protein n=1 Tax=Halogeometricum pallidum JCM 14848 TaxID=1227487 RepID=M0DEI1_HALPD|nr:NosD domain-containing protein [Halogeometricum pallidum]ELZ33901.1 periplasmic copper-binding protein [Halogeometricum pallidum JCM 14848]